MMYEVTYQVGGQEQTDRVDAPDAAGAESAVRELRGHSDDMFELLLVHLVEVNQHDPAPVGSLEDGVTAGV